MKISRETNEQVEFLRQIAEGRQNEQIAKLFQEKFNVPCDRNHIKYLKYKYKISSNVRNKLAINDKQIQFLKDNVNGTKLKDLTNMFNEHFGLNFTENQIDWYKYKLGLKSGLNFKWEKGHKPYNVKPIGYEFKCKDNGYTFIKVSEPDLYMLKQRYVYEQHYGKIPKGYSVVFLNGNKEDFSIDNLTLARQKDILTCKNKKLFSSNRDVTKTGLVIAQFSNTLYEIKKGQISYAKIEKKH